MLHMVAVKRLDVTVVVVGVSCRASCKAIAVVESLAAANKTIKQSNCDVCLSNKLVSLLCFSKTRDF